MAYVAIIVPCLIMFSPLEACGLRGYHCAPPYYVLSSTGVRPMWLSLCPTLLCSLLYRRKAYVAIIVSHLIMFSPLQAYGLRGYHCVPPYYVLSSTGVRPMWLSLCPTLLCSLLYRRVAYVAIIVSRLIMFSPLEACGLRGYHCAPPYHVLSSRGVWPTWLSLCPALSCSLL